MLFDTAKLSLFALITQPINANVQCHPTHLAALLVPPPPWLLQFSPSAAPAGRRDHRVTLSLIPSGSVPIAGRLGLPDMPTNLYDMPTNLLAVGDAT